MDRTSCAQAHELPWGHWWIGKNRRRAHCLSLYYAHLTSVRFKHSVFHESLLTSFIYIYIYIYIYICLYCYQKITAVIIKYKNNNSNSNERKWSYCLKENVLVVCKFYIICMDIQRVLNSLFLIWRSQGSLIVSIPLVLSSIFWDLKTVTIQYRDIQKYWFCEDYTNLFLDTNVSLRISGDKPRWILNISVAKTCKFLWCIKTELSLFSSSWNVDVLSWYVILRTLSCIEFISAKTSTVEHPN